MDLDEPRNGANPSRKRGRPDDNDFHSGSRPPIGAGREVGSGGPAGRTCSFGSPDSLAEGSNEASHVPYCPNASIFLVGMAGAGKKTLAVMGSVALGWNFLDFKSYFRKITSISPKQYLERYGMKAYTDKDLQIAELVTRECSQNYIVAGLAEIVTASHRALLINIGRSHPVIYVRRAKDELREFVSSNRDEFERWHEQCSAFYHSGSTIDYYNLSAGIEVDSNSSHTTLKLKHVEIDFIRMLRRLSGRLPSLLHSSDLLSPCYTYALEVALPWLEECPNVNELECGADAIRFVVAPDDISDEFSCQIAKQIAILRRSVRVPIILAVQGPVSSKYWTLLRLGLRCCPDVVAVNLTIEASKLRSVLYPRSNVKIIGELNQNEPWELIQDKWPSIEDTAKALSCDALRISRSAEQFSDNLSCLIFRDRMARSGEIPLIAFNTGLLGRLSAILNPILSPVSLTRHGFDVKDAQRLLYSCHILQARSFTIFGASVSYTLSPAMHNAAFDAVGLPHRYTFFQSEVCSDIERLYEDERCGGIAVTLPYKTQILSLLHFISSEAQDIGAVNTIKVEREQQAIVLKGYNTDHIGIRECIYRHLSPVNSVRESTSALIIGAGGMARATIYALRTLGVKHLCLYNRTVKNAADLAQRSLLDARVLHNDGQEWPPDMRLPSIVVAAIPAHKINETPAHELQIPEKWLNNRTGGVFIELAYKPCVTPFIKQMRGFQSRGWITVQGIEVLVEQGIAQFEIFTGRPAPIHVMRQAVRQHYARIGQEE